MIIEGPIFIPLFGRSRSSVSAPSAVGFGAEGIRRRGLLAYGASHIELTRRAMFYVALPIEQPTKFGLAINLKTAKASA